MVIKYLTQWMDAILISLLYDVDKIFMIYHICNKTFSEECDYAAVTLTLYTISIQKRNEFF
jgi:hypothetical protein